MSHSKRFCLDVRGDFACFTRPEMKVERVSYDVITPSAARALFECIFWKPAVCWQVRRIELLAPVRWVNLRRNEVKSKVPVPSVTSAMAHGGPLDIYADDSDERVQRAGLFLRDVHYRLHADLNFLEGRQDRDPPQKFFAMFERRARAGQCVNQPYLGCREFDARVRFVEDPTAERPAVDETRDLGWMLHDLDFTDLADPKPTFFRAQMTRGVIDVSERRLTS
jgi:CRISPR-associated protein Cas5d